MTTLAEDLPKEQARCRQILIHAAELGPAGMILVALLNLSLQRAEQAAASGDIVVMLEAYEDLTSYKE